MATSRRHLLRLSSTIPVWTRAQLSARASRVLPVFSKAYQSTGTAAAQCVTQPTNTLSSSSSNPPLSFPCVDKLNSRTEELDNGPEPSYDRVVTGYETFEYAKPFLLDHGGVLPKLDVAYETWGTLNEKKDNAILIHTGLSASSHAKSHPKNTKPGWWEEFIGPGLYIDTNKFFVICTNVIGGCYGSTGPSSIDPADGERYATRFPILTIFDMVRAQFLLLDHMGIDKLHASVGSSMGGMQSVAAASLFPERVKRLISISACIRSHPYSIALRHTQRQVLMADPNWNKGFYYKGVPPHVGMKLSREIATISYRSGPEWELRFGRKRAQENQTPALCPDFLIETYLDHQGERFCLQYDANSLLYISKAMDIFDMSKSATDALKQQRKQNLHKLEEIDKHDFATVVGNQSALEMHDTPPTESKGKDRPTLTTLAHTDPNVQDLVNGMKGITMPTLILGAQSDILFPVWQQKEIAECLRAAGNKRVTYYELDAMFGHDTFLIDKTSVGGAVKGHLELLD